MDIVEFVAFYSHNGLSSLAKAAYNHCATTVLHFERKVVGRHSILVALLAIFASVTLTIIDNLLLANWAG